VTQELLYTSAAQGLDPGSRGFCTVVRTRSMPAPLAPLLESLSGYRPAFAINDPRAAENPVSYSHVRVAAGGKTYSVLSRVADYGLDYSQRTNKIAHHVALASDERPEAGPAWLLVQPGFMDTRWDGQPRTLPAGRRVPTGAERVAACPTWAAVTGDAGWAGILAESWLTGTASYLIVAPGTDTLALIREAVALLPPRKRWDATFSTYYTGVPGSATCSCRCVLADSPETVQARRLPNVLRIDLTQKLPAARGGDLVNVARTGPQKRTPTGRPEPAHPALPHAPEGESVPFAIPLAGSTPRTREGLSLQNVPAGPPPLEPRIRKADDKKRVPVWVWLIASLSAAAVFFGAIFLFVVNHSPQASIQVAGGDAAIGEAKKPAPQPVNAGSENKNKTVEHPKDAAGEPHKANTVPGQSHPEPPIATSSGQRKEIAAASADGQKSSTTHRAESKPEEHSKPSDQSRPSPTASPTAKVTPAKPKSGLPVSKEPVPDKRTAKGDAHPPPVPPAGKLPIAESPDRFSPSPPPKVNSPSVLRLPDFRAGNISHCDIDLPKNQTYSVTCIMPVDHKVLLPPKPGATVLKAVHNSSGFALEQNIDMATKKQILQIDLAPDKNQLNFDLTHLQKADPNPTAQELRDLIHFSRVSTRAKAFGVTPIEWQFFNPRGSSVSAQTTQPRVSPKSQVGKLVSNLNVPQGKWQMPLPVPLSSVSPTLYVERITLRMAGIDYEFVAAKANLIKYPKGTLQLRCDKLSHALACLAVEDAMLGADKVEKLLADHDAILSLHFDEGNKVDSNSVEASIDLSQLNNALRTVFTEHRNRFVRLLAAASPQFHPPKGDLSTLPEQIQRAERQVGPLHEAAAIALNSGLKTLKEQRSQIHDCLAPLGKATIVQARIYYKIKDFSHPGDEPGEMDLLRIDPPSAAVQHSDRPK
jgi:hypothetical protein